jgi:hypothetical protein
MLIRLSGADPDILRQFPAECAVYSGMATAILSTGAIAGVSMWFALHTALAVAPAWAAVFAAGWAIIIMALDRWLVVSMRRRDDWQQKPWRYFAWASPRLFLALLFGFIISTPFTLQIFNSDIETQLVLIHDAAWAALQKGPVVQLKATISTDQQNVAKLVAQAKSGGQLPDPAQDGQVKFLHGELKAAQGQAQAEYIAWQCQLYGQIKGSSVTCSSGPGPLATTDGKLYGADEQLVTAYQNDITKRMDELAAQGNAEQQLQEQQATSQLPVARQQLTAAEQQLQAQESTFSAANAHDTGLLERIRALDDAAGSDPLLNLARGLLFLFFLMFDCLPVLTKIFLNIAPPGAYERALKEDETKRTAAAAQVSQRRLDDETALTQARAAAHKRLAGEAAAVEEQLMRDELARRTGGRGGIAVRGDRGGWSWARRPAGRRQAGGRLRPMTVYQRFDPGTAGNPSNGSQNGTSNGRRPTT